MKYRLRYAPSPTGFLHIGNTRTAMMNFLFAKSKKGTFVLRIEDTDFEREVDGAVESQLENLKWLGIMPDEYFDKPNPKYGEYFQSKKLKVYEEYANKLISENKAYRCFCTPEDLNIEKERQTSMGIVATKYNKKCLGLSKQEIEDNLKNKIDYSIRFKVLEDMKYKINDLVRGEVTFESQEIGDFIILKSNKVATYNFAVVVDDKDMEITHVVRGEEHISNTPRQLMIYEAFGWTPPIFCHLTLIVDSTKKKLSKRSGNALFFISQYKEQGYLPQAIFNYISLLGWSPSGENEIFSIDELVNLFDENRFSKSPSTFDMVKMKWFNSQWMKKISEEEYLSFVKGFIKKEFMSNDKEWLNRVLLLFKKEIEYAIQINDHLPLFFSKLHVSENDWDILKQTPNWRQLVEEFYLLIKNEKELTEEKVSEIIKKVGVITSNKGKDLFKPIRIVSTHQEHGPELAKTISLLGLEKVLNNIKNFRG